MRYKILMIRNVLITCPDGGCVNREEITEAILETNLDVTEINADSKDLWTIKGNWRIVSAEETSEVGA